jgi:hydrogenase-4 component F
MTLVVALLALPVVAGLAAFWLPSARVRMSLLLGTAALHLCGCLAAWCVPCAPGSGDWIGLDALGLVVLTVASAVFLAVAVASRAFLAAHEQRGERVFAGCLFGFLAAATLVAESQHLALMWIGMEATTLAMAPLVFHSRNRRSLEAVWKYLLLSSVGIGLALFGTFFLAAAQGAGRPLILGDLVLHAASLQPGLLRAAFVFLLVGYGTKMGLAPLHAWKPDTYGEAPAPVSGLMAGALTSCAFLGLARVTQVMVAAHQFGFVRPPLLALGLASLVVSAGFSPTRASSTWGCWRSRWASAAPACSAPRCTSLATAWSRPPCSSRSAT